MGDTFVRGGREGARFEIIHGVDGDLAVETDAYAAYRQDQELREKLSLANVLEVDRPYVGEDARQNMPKLRLYSERFEKKYRGVSLYLWSRQNGTQKSTVARWLARSLIRQGRTAHFVLMGALTRALTRRGFDDEDEWLLDTVASVDFLVIDDAFDPKKVTLYKSGYQLPFLDEFLRQRLEVDRRATCFTSNVPIDEIDNLFGPSLRSLVKRSVPTPMEMVDPVEDFSVEDLWKE